MEEEEKKEGPPIMTVSLEKKVGSAYYDSLLREERGADKDDQ